MKKRICIVLTFVLLALCLTACAKTSNSNPQTLTDVLSTKKEKITQVRLFESDTGKEILYTQSADIATVFDVFDRGGYLYQKTTTALPIGATTVAFKSQKQTVYFYLQEDAVWVASDRDNLKEVKIYGMEDVYAIEYVHELLGKLLPPSSEALKKDMADFSDLTGLRKEDIASVYLFSSDTGKEMEITDPAQVKAIVEKFDVAYRFVRVEEPLVGPPSIGFHTAQEGFGFTFGTGEIYRKIPDDKLHNMLVYAPADPSCLAYAKALLGE